MNHISVGREKCRRELLIQSVLKGQSHNLSIKDKIQQTIYILRFIHQGNKVNNRKMPLREKMSSSRFVYKSVIVKLRLLIKMKLLKLSILTFVCLQC